MVATVWLASVDGGVSVSSARGRGEAGLWRTAQASLEGQADNGPSAPCRWRKGVHGTGSRAPVVLFRQFANSLLHSAVPAFTIGSRFGHSSKSISGRSCWGAAGQRRPFATSESARANCRREQVLCVLCPQDSPGEQVHTLPRRGVRPYLGRSLNHTAPLARLLSRTLDEFPHMVVATGLGAGPGS